MKPYKILIFFYLLFSVLTVASQNVSADCWPSFRGDAQLTGNAVARLSPPLRLLWSFKTEDAIKSSPVICNGAIYIGSNDGYLYALSFTGKLLWKFNAGSAIEAAPLYLDKTIYVGSLEGVLFAVDATTGKLKWKYATEGQIQGKL